jgi:hypothetical protein
MAGEVKPKVFRSMAELREHFFPKQFRKEQEKRKLEAVMGKPRDEKQITKEQEQDLVREMGL